jgi:hypothetical protein
MVGRGDDHDIDILVVNNVLVARRAFNLAIELFAHTGDARLQVPRESLALSPLVVSA